MSNNGERVIRGKWNDPYSGKVFYQSKQMDVDHVVPLFYSWKRGARNWTTAQRRQFANDSANLLAVDAGLNRAKSAQGFTDWMPPNPAYRCQYILRFDRIMRKYGLTYLDTERIKATRMIQSCKK
jgi:hypothetical protein